MLTTFMWKEVFLRIFTEKQVLSSFIDFHTRRRLIVLFVLFYNHLSAFRLCLTYNREFVSLVYMIIDI